MISGFTEKYDAVMGAGHAGREAAMAVRAGLKTALYTINLDLIVQMCCDPAEQCERQMQRESLQPMLETVWS